MNRDLTVGKPSVVLRNFCLPLFASVIFQQLYNIADSFVAGKFLGETSLAAVGNSYEITLIFIAFGFGCNIGCSVIVSNFYGGKRYKDLKTAVYTTFISTAAICALLMFFGLAFCDLLLTLINTPADIFDDSEAYLKIYIYSLPFILFYNVATGIFSALGDSRTPFYFLLFSSVSNIFMDVLFVTSLREWFTKGVEAVAWATFICQGISCIFAVVLVMRRIRKLPCDEKPRAFSLSILKYIAAIALPSTFQQSFISVGNIILQGVINSFGSGVTAGYAASVKLNNLVITSFTTLGNGVSNYTAQNIGAKKYERIRDGFKAGVKMVWLISIPIFVVYFFAPDMLVKLFLDTPSKDALSNGIAFLRIVSPLYFVASVKLVSDGVLRGSGKMNKFMFSTLADLVIRVVLAKVLSVFFGPVGIWAAWPFGWIVGTALSYYFSSHIRY